MGVTQGAGLSLKWFKDQFCQDYVAEAKKQGVDVYDLINRDIEKIPVGSDRLLLSSIFDGRADAASGSGLQGCILWPFRDSYKGTSAAGGNGRCILFPGGLQ